MYPPNEEFCLPSLSWLHSGEQSAPIQRVASPISAAETIIIANTMPKYPLTLLFLSVATLSCQGSKLHPIALPSPDLSALSSAGDAFRNRCSTREFVSEDLTLQQLSNLLWAANGINRSAEGKRTAPSSRNSQEIDLYVVMAKGTYRYNALKHQLDPVAEGDFRALVAGSYQKEFAEAPVSIVMVADLRKLGEGQGTDRDIRSAHIDGGIVSQNINLYCAAAGLATVPRTSMESDSLAKALQLDAKQLPIINNPVALPKK